MLLLEADQVAVDRCSALLDRLISVRIAVFLSFEFLLADLALKATSWRARLTPEFLLQALGGYGIVVSKHLLV